MGDQAHDFAERKIAEFQAEVRDTYQQAQADAQEALSRFLKRFEKEDERQREKVKAGELSEADYKAWRKGKILRSRQLSSTLDQVSRAMTEANQVAVAALAGRLPEVYAENANYAAFQVCEASGLDLAFSLVDAPTVQHMLTAGEALFIVPALDVAKDVAWNRRLMASQLTQGVLLGESIPKMARRVQSVTGSNVATATRTARTAVTGAECAGRVSSYERARDMGIKLKQEWVATLDGRTRHSHRKLDGVKAEVGGTFPNGCRFPGDPTARYAEICNCRCTLVAAVEGFETDDAKRASKLPKGMTYEEWKSGHAERKPHDSSGRTMGEFLGQPSVKAQLDKRGMSENQARKALSAELKRRGADGNAFRRMQRSGQQDVWRAVRQSGAITRKNDPDGKRRFEHAVRYYKQVRNRDPKREIDAVSKNSGIGRDLVETAYRHVFIEKHDLSGGHRRFDPDYDMSQSWQRLREGKEVLPHDVVLIRHEAAEAEYMKGGMSYEDAHAKACKDGYNYQLECDKWKNERE